MNCLPLLLFIFAIVCCTSVSASSVQLNRTHWFSNNCSNSYQLLRQKDKIIRKVNGLMNSETFRTEQVSPAELKLKRKLYLLFAREVNEAERFIYSAIGVLQKTLKGNFNEIDALKESSIKRIKNLQQAIFTEELELREISRVKTDLLKVEHHKLSRNNSDSVVKKLFAELLTELQEVASDIGVDTHLNDMPVLNIQNQSGLLGAKPIGEIEAVYQLRQEETDDRNRPAEILVDTRNNKYVLSKPKDSTMSFEDRRLILDILLIVICSFLFSFVMSSLSLPSVLGYIVAGVLLGPSGLNVITDVIQIETLGEIGVFFAVFDVGLEFAMSKVDNFWRVTFLTFPTVSLLLFSAVGFLAFIIDLSVVEIGLISFCFAVSTTHLTPKSSSNGGSEDYLKMYLSGQDIYLGVVLAFIPYLSERKLEAFLLIYPLKTIIFCVVLYYFVRYSANSLSSSEGPLPASLRHILNVNFPFLLIMVLFSIVLLADYLKVSIDLVCIFLGAVLHNESAVAKTQERLQVLKQVFSALFYATIGFHVFPSFVYYELSLVIVLTAAVLSIKFCLLLFVFSRLFPKLTPYQRMVATVCSCNVGELSLIVGNRARLHNLLSKEVYLLVISVSTVSLSLVPLWNLFLANKSPPNLIPH